MAFWLGEVNNTQILPLAYHFYLEQVPRQVHVHRRQCQVTPNPGRGEGSWPCPFSWYWLSYETCLQVLRSKIYYPRAHTCISDFVAVMKGKVGIHPEVKIKGTSEPGAGLVQVKEEGRREKVVKCSGSRPALPYSCYYFIGKRDPFYSETLSIGKSGPLQRSFC